MVNLNLRDPNLVDKAKAAMAMRCMVPDDVIQEIIDNAPTDSLPSPEEEYDKSKI